MINNTTIAEIGQLFTDNGYIKSDYGIMQYDNCTRQFDYVQDNEVLDIFRRVYPNFERRVLKVEMIEKHLPQITENEFAVYDLVKSKLTRKPMLNDTRLKEVIQEIITENNNNKKPVENILATADYEQCIQYLINNDIFYSDGALYKYEDGLFRFIGITEIQHLLKKVMLNTPTLKETTKIMYIGFVDLKDIGGIVTDCEIVKDKETITDADKKIYSKIQNLIELYKENAENDQ